MEYLSTKYGLTGEGDLVSENGQEFLAELILLAEQYPSSKEEVANWNNVMDRQLANCKVEDGLYHRNPDLIDRRVMSHDNLSGIFSWSYCQETEHAREIWWYLLTHFGTYDNSQGKSDQFSKYLPFNPSNFFIWGKCAGSWIYIPFIIFYLPSLIICCNKPSGDTTGKILSWLELYPFRNHWLIKYLYNYFDSQMTKQYGTSEYIKPIMKLYHGNHSPEFPIRKILGI